MVEQGGVARRTRLYGKCSHGTSWQPGVPSPQGEGFQIRGPPGCTITKATLGIIIGACSQLRAADEPNSGGIAGGIEARDTPSWSISAVQTATERTVHSQGLGRDLRESGGQGPDPIMSMASHEPAAHRLGLFPSAARRTRLARSEPNGDPGKLQRP